MAGIAKPNYDVKKEAMYKFIGGSVGIGSLNGLFDGTTPNDWQSAQVAYWNANGNYLEIEFFEPVKLHRFYSWNNNNVQRLKILRHDGTGYNEDLTHLHKDISTQTPLTWQQFTEVLPLGRYQFSLDTTDTGKTGRVDGEWYVESTVINKTLILSGNKYKKLKPPIEAIIGKSEIPKMTSDTTPSGIASASSTYSESYPAWLAFDTVKIGNGQGWATANGVVNGWLAYEFPTPVVISKYILTSREESIVGESPKKWTFEGWDSTNSEWDILDTRVNEVNWGKNEDREYKFSNNKAYKKYRINITQNNGYIGFTIIQELAMYSADTPSSPAEWETVSTTLPTQEQFLSDGMDSLSPLLDRRVETLEPLPMSDKSEILQGGEGKVFSKTVSLDKYIDLRNIKVEVK